MNFKLQQKVEILNSCKQPIATGKVVGFGHYFQSGMAIPQVIVELDMGFYNMNNGIIPQDKIFTNNMLVHPENLL